MPSADTLNFDWSALLVNNPTDPTCTVSSSTNGLINPLNIVLPTSPASQNRQWQH